MRPLLIALLVVPAIMLFSSPAEAASIRLTLLSAKLDRLKLKPHEHSVPPAPPELACLSLLGLRLRPGGCDASHAPADDDPRSNPRSNPQINPLLRMEIQDRVVRTYAVPGSLAPRWDYGVILDPAFIKSSRFVDFVLFDAHGPGDEVLVAGKRLKPGDLLRPGTRRVKIGGGEFSYKVEWLKDGQPPRSYHFRIPAAEPATDLARNAKAHGEGYVVIPVSEGEKVEVRADFRGCPTCGRTMLSAQIGATQEPVGDHKEFTAGTSGLLEMVLQNVRAADKEYGVEVQITVSPPGSGPPSATTLPAGKKGGRRGKTTGASGPGEALVQQVMDAHGGEIEECVAEAADPNGDVVLLFSISADGRPLGVTVENAPQNLRKAGECVRTKALKWKFPAPRTMLTARYTMSFSQE